MKWSNIFNVRCQESEFRRTTAHYTAAAVFYALYQSYDYVLETDRLRTGYYCCYYGLAGVHRTCVPTFRVSKKTARTLDAWVIWGDKLEKARRDSEFRVAHVLPFSRSQDGPVKPSRMEIYLRGTSKWCSNHSSPHGRLYCSTVQGGVHDPDGAIAEAIPAEFTGFELQQGNACIP